MLLTINNLPNSTRYIDIKQMIQQKCGISELILDNLVSDGKGNKKVTVGVAEEGDAAILVRKINGIFIGGQQLYVENVKQSKPSEQPYHSTNAIQQLGSHNQDVYQNQIAQQSLGQPHNVQAQSQMMNYMAPPMYYMPINPMMQGTEKQFMNMSSQSQLPLMAQYSQFEAAISQDLGYGRNNKEPQASSGNWGSGNDRSFDDIHRADGWQQQSVGIAPTMHRQPSPKRDNNYGGGQQANDFGVMQSNWGQVGTVAPNNRNEREPAWGQGNMGWQDNSRQESRWEQPSASRDDRNRRDDQNRRENRKRRGGGNRSDGGNRGDARRGDQNRQLTQVNWDVGNKLPNPGFNTSNTSSVLNSDNFFGNHVTGFQPPAQVARGQKREQPNRWEVNRANSGPGQANRPRPEFKPHQEGRRDTKPFKPEKKDRFQNKRPNDRSNQGPPSKKPALDQRKEPKNAPANQPEQNMTKLLNKDRTWRGQAAAVISRQTLRTVNISDKDNKDLIVKKLKASINSRIDVLLGEQVAVPMEDIIRMYRQRFHVNRDEGFFRAVLDSIKDEDKIDISAGVKPKTDVKPPKPADPAPAGTAGQAKVKIPKYPNKDKKAYNQLQQVRKQEVVNPDMYKLPPELEKAVEEQADLLCDLFMLACEKPDAEGEGEKPDNEYDKRVREKLSDIVADDFRKIIRLQLAKRLLNIKTGLLVRVITKQKVNKPALMSFLAEYKVVSFKKSVRKVGLYVASFANYDGYDRILALEETTIDGVTVLFKPMHIIGRPSVRKNKKGKTAEGEEHDENASGDDENDDEFVDDHDNDQVDDHENDKVDDHDNDQVDDHDNDQVDDHGDDDEHNDGQNEDIPDIDEANEDDLEDY